MSFFEYTRVVAAIQAKQSQKPSNPSIDNIRARKKLNLHYLEPIKEAGGVLED